jgi:hypothetical protein
MPSPTLDVEGWVGTLWKPIIEVHNEAGALTNASSLVVKLRRPDDTETTVEAPKIGTGEYQPEIPITSPGPWILIPESTTPTAPGKLIFKAVQP